MQLVLSLMPGIDLLGMAFKEAGFCVVRGGDPIFGGDVRTERYPPGKFDGCISGPPCQSFSSLARLVRHNGHEPRFGNLIPEFERCVKEAQPQWFVMENVPGAPCPAVDGYGIKSILLDNSRLLGGNDDNFGQEQRRVRRISFGLRGEAEPPSLMRWIDLALWVLPDAVVAVTSSDGGERKATKERRAALSGDGRPMRQEVRVRRNAVSSSNGGNGKERVRPGAGNNGKSRYRFAEACRLQGLPENFLADAPFTADGKLKAVANGVPMSMGRAIAKAFLEAIGETQ